MKGLRTNFVIFKTTEFHRIKNTYSTHTRTKKRKKKTCRVSEQILSFLKKKCPFSTLKCISKEPPQLYKRARGIIENEKPPGKHAV